MMIIKVKEEMFKKQDELKLTFFQRIYILMEIFYSKLIEIVISVLIYGNTIFFSLFFNNTPICEFNPSTLLPPKNIQCDINS